MFWSLFFLHFFYLRSTFAGLVNTTIDDAFPGDTDSSISYSPSDAWLQGSATNHGRVMPDASRAEDGTWHDTTDDTTPDHDGTTPTFMEINFQGTGIDVRCIIANNKAANASIPPFTGTNSNYSFFIDTVPQNRDFVYEAGTTGDAFLYNTSVFSTNSLSNGSHTSKLLLNGGPEYQDATLLLFDYAIVTSDDGTGDAGPGTTGGGTPSATPPTPGTTSPPAITSSTGTGSKPSGASLSSQSRTVGPGNSTTATGLTIQTPGPTGTTPIQSTTPAQSTTPIQSAPANSSSPLPSITHKSNLGTIVGSLVGGLALVLLLFLLFWFRRRRSHRLRIPALLPLPYFFPYFRPRSLPPRETDEVDPSPAPSSSPPQKPNQTPPVQSTSSPSGTSAESNADPAMRDYVQRLRTEVELLREQQREMVAIRYSEPPPRYEEA